MARHNSAACFLVLLFVASNLEAAVTPLAERIRLTQNIADTFQIAEVQAFETGTGTNVALQGNGGVAGALDTGFGTIPGDANDGNLDQSFGGGSVWHSGSGAGTWWEVNLAAPAQLDAITILGRFPCCPNRQDDFDLEIFDGAGNTLFFQNVLGLGTSPGNQGTISGLAPFTGLEAAVPEPSAFLLGGMGLAGLGLATWRRRRRR